MAFFLHGICCKLKEKIIKFVQPPVIIINPNFMKKLISIALLFFAMGVFAGAAIGQTSSKQAAKDAKAAAMKDRIESGHFTFIAQFIQPLGGGQHYLTDEYDLRVKKDSVIA